MTISEEIDHINKSIKNEFGEVLKWSYSYKKGYELAYVYVVATEPDPLSGFSLTGPPRSKTARIKIYINKTL